LVTVLDIGEGHSQLTVGGLLGGPVEGADGGGEGGVDLVATTEGGLQEISQLIGVEVLGSRTAEAADDLLGA
jgi:hypothetical protein